MASPNPVPPFDKDGANRFKNKEAIDTIISQLLGVVLLWGCKKQGNESFWEFLQRKYQRNPATLDEKYTDRERERLQANDISAFGVPLLKEIILDVCEDFELPEKKKFAQTVTTFMNQLKKIRNNVSHRPTTDAISPTVLQDIEKIVPKLLTASAQLFTIDPQTEKDQTDRVMKMFKELKEKTLNEKDKIIKRIREKFCSDGKKEIEKVVKNESKDFLLAGEQQLVRRDIFYECKVTVVTEGQANLQTQENEKTIKCGALLALREDSNIIIILGEPGAGKSTLVRKLREDFVSTQSVIFRGVKKYELIVSMECRKNDMKTIPELIRWNFPEICRGIKADYIVDALLTMKVLFVVDGIDESSINSQLLLQSLIDTFRHCKGTKFILASRPGATQYLEKELGRAGCSTTVAKLQPLTTEHVQIEFLERYQKPIPGIDVPELINAFKGLDVSCKKHLIYPVHLTWFCFLYQSSPDEVSKWRDEVSIMRQILKYSNTQIKKRLEQKGVSNSESLASKIVNDACNLAVRQMAQNKMTIQLETYDKFAEDLLGETGVSYEAIMSCLYVSQLGRETYEYIHLAHAEFMAATALFDKLIHNNMSSIGEILQACVGSESPHQAAKRRRTEAEAGAARGDAAGSETHQPNRAWLSTQEALRYGNTFKFVLMLMVEASTLQQDLLRRTVDDICRYPPEGTMPFSYWAELYLACPSPAEAEAFARVAKSETMEGSRSRWDVDNPRYMRVATDMLPYHQPPAMRVFTPSSEAAPCTLEPLMMTVGEHFTGTLDLSFLHSFRSFTPVDKLITHLLDSSCKLVAFWGCLDGGHDTWKLLMHALQRAVKARMELTVGISLLKPRHHDLSYINKTSHILDVRAKTSALDCDRCRRPLPMSKTRPPTITVHSTEVGEDAAAHAAALIEDLAPEDKQYQSIWVQHWKGNDGQLTHLTGTLAKAGLSTKGTFNLRWMHATTNRDDSCVVCQESSHRPGERCLLILLPEVDPRDINDTRKVATNEEMTEVIAELPDHHFPWLDVSTRKKKGAPPALGPLMEAIGAWHKGTLDLNLRHSYRKFVPVDHILTPLQSAQCALVIFRGCLSGDSEQAWRALTAAFLRAEQKGLRQYLFLSLPQPRKHMLDQLEGTQHRLKIMIRLPLNPGARCRRPLPASAFAAPVLVVDCSPPEGAGQPADEKAVAEQVAALIEDLTPEDMRFFMLYLMNWPGTDDDALDELVNLLSAAGTTTKDLGSPSWAPARVSAEGECDTCNERNHRQGERCVQLLLP